MSGAAGKGGLTHLRQELYKPNHPVSIDPKIHNDPVILKKKKTSHITYRKVTKRRESPTPVSTCLHMHLYLTHYHTMPHFDALKIYSCGKHCEKRRNCL